VREFPDRPIVGVGAIVVDRDRVLIVKRAHEPLAGEWSLPGGAVEVGEKLEAAIAREVCEETGLEVEVGPIVDVLDRVRYDSGGRVKYHFVLIDFLCRVSGGTLAAASDADAVAWATLDEIAALGIAEATVTVIRKGFDRLAGVWTPAQYTARPYT
jgi:8-oxo-dGTP diphosphatase